MSTKLDYTLIRIKKHIYRFLHYHKEPKDSHSKVIERLIREAGYDIEPYKAHRVPPTVVGLNQNVREAERDG